MNALYTEGQAPKGLIFAITDDFTRWRHHLEIFSVLLALWAGNSPVTGEFPSQRPVTWSFHVFFDLRLNKWLSKQSWGWWFEMPSGPLWRHCNELLTRPTVMKILQTESPEVLPCWKNLIFSTQYYVLCSANINSNMKYSYVMAWC